MSNSDNFKLIDVKGDGSCFYRSIYHSIQNTIMLEKIIRFFNYLYNEDVELSYNPSEYGFVKFTRLLLAKLVFSRNDYKIVKDVFKYLNTLDEDTYNQVVSSFPDWFIKSYSYFKKMPEHNFRIYLGTSIEKTKNWVSQIEINIIQKVLEEVGITIIILNNTVKRKIKFKKNEIYILNIDEYHYKSIVPYDTNSIYYDMNDDYPITSYRKLSIQKPLRENSSYRSPKKSKSKVNLKECEKGKIRHPVSNRCVIITGVKGQEALKLLGKKTSSPKLKAKASPKKSKSKVNLKECEKGKIRHPVSNRCVIITGVKGQEALKLLGKKTSSPKTSSPKTKSPKTKAKASPKKSKSKVNLKECEKGKIRHPVSNRCVIISGIKGQEALKLLGKKTDSPKLKAKASPKKSKSSRKSPKLKVKRV